MNVIEYLLKQVDLHQAYSAWGDLPVQAYHFSNTFGEGVTSIYCLQRQAEFTVATAITALILMPAVRDGTYAYEPNDEWRIVQLVTNELEREYQTLFCSVKQPSLSDRIAALSELAHKPYQEPEPLNTPLITFQEFAASAAFQQPSREVYHLHDLWNDEDYLFITDNYFIRVLWSTTA